MTAWLTLILSATTCTVPGFLLLLDAWGRVPAWAVGLTMLATAVVLVPATRAALRADPPSDPGSDSDSGPASELVAGAAMVSAA